MAESAVPHYCYQANKAQKKSPQSVADNEVDVTAQPHIRIDECLANGTLRLTIDKRTCREWKSKLGELDPAMVFNWSANLPTALANLNEHQPPFPNWAPVAMQYPLALDTLKMLILNHCQLNSTAGGISDLFCIAPNNFIESMSLVSKLSALLSDPFIMLIADWCGDYIARIYFFFDSKPKVSAQPAQLPRPPNLPAQHIQAFV